MHNKRRLIQLNRCKTDHVPAFFILVAKLIEVVVGDPAIIDTFVFDHRRLSYKVVVNVWTQDTLISPIT